MVVYDYVPNARTLQDVHFKPNADPIPENTIWSYIVQIANAMKAIHDRRLAVRSLDVSKILEDGRGRCPKIVDGVDITLTINYDQNSVKRLRRL